MRDYVVIEAVVVNKYVLKNKLVAVLLTRNSQAWMISIDVYVTS